MKLTKFEYLLGIACLLFNAIAFATEKAPSPRIRPAAYDVHVDLFPVQGFLKATARIHLQGEGTLHPPLSFFLHETFQIEELRVNGQRTPFSMTAASRENSRPACNRIDVQLDANIPAKDVEVFLRYDGALKKLPQWGLQKHGQYAMDDHIGPERVELACYSGWYPLWGFGPKFDVDMSITLPKGWTLAASGKMRDITEEGKRTRSLWRSVSDQDLVILASPRFRTLQVPTGSHFGTIAVIHTSLPIEYVRRESRELADTLNLFNRWLPQPKKGNTGLRHVFSPRESGQGGYSRPGLVVTSEGRIQAYLKKNLELSFLRGNAHEVAHFWWSFSRNQADWINESFAEYFSLLAVEHLVSKEKMEKLLSTYADKVAALPEDVPPLSKIPADNSGHGYTVRYYQGALMLHAFRKRMGKEAFIRAGRDFYLKYAKEGADSSEFRNYWSRQEPLGSDFVDHWLDTPGGELVPEKKEKEAPEYTTHPISVQAGDS